MLDYNYTITLRFLGAGIFLLGLLKLFALWTDPFADLTAGFPKIIIFEAACLELILGFAVVARVRSILVWGATTTFFVLMTILSASRSVLGFETCGCAGSLELPPWIAMVADSLVVLFLMLSTKSIYGNSFTQQIRLLRDSGRNLDEVRIGVLVGVAVVAVLVLFIDSDRAS